MERRGILTKRTARKWLKAVGQLSARNASDKSELNGGREKNRMHLDSNGGQPLNC